MWMTQPDGTTPRIGDMDDARAWRFERRAHWDFRNILASGAVLFERSDFLLRQKRATGQFLRPL